MKTNNVAQSASGDIIQLLDELSSNVSFNNKKYVGIYTYIWEGCSKWYKPQPDFRFVAYLAPEQKFRQKSELGFLILKDVIVSRRNKC